MHIVFIDSPQHQQALQPLSLTRPISEFRVGILTIREKWEKRLNKTTFGFITAEHLKTKFSLPPSDTSKQNQECFVIASNILPDTQLIDTMLAMPPNSFFDKEGEILLLRTDLASMWEVLALEEGKVQSLGAMPHELTTLAQLTDIFKLNEQELKKDFELLTKGRSSAPITDPHTIVYGKENIFLEEGVKIKAAILNAENGIIYLGKNAQVSEGSIIQGNFALCEGASVNLGGKMRPNTTIGPYCKVGGEISNCVFFGYSNKAHDGFLGNSVLGEWCNLGADTNSSNLKNNYGSVKLWSYVTLDFEDTGLNFVGLMMGDHSKAGINTMFNTGTVVGVSANVFGAGFPPKHIPSFAWGGSTGFERFKIEKAFEVAERVMLRRQKVLTEADKDILREIYHMTQLDF